MSDAASVRSIAELRAFQSTLRQAANSSADAVRGAESAAGVALRDLNERLRECERAREQAVRELEIATTAFAICLRSGTHDDEGHYHPPNCSAEERIVDTCQHLVREAEQQVARVKSWVAKVEGEVQAFRSQAQRLRNFTNVELRRADMLLAGKVSDLEAYLAARAAGTAADITAGATYTPLPSVQPEGAPRLVSVRSNPSPEVLASPEREPRTVVLGRSDAAYPLSYGITAAAVIQAARAIEALRTVDGIAPDEWADLTPTERIGVLRDVEATMARVQGRPDVSVVIVPLEEGLCGTFDRESMEMEINKECLRDDDPSEWVDTVVHEGRHAYQDYAIAHPEVGEDPALLATWAANSGENYISPEQLGAFFYRAQPREADAWAFAKFVRDGLYMS